MTKNKKLRIWKGGRPRKDRPTTDTGTSELILKRAIIGNGDPTLSTCPLDAIFARGIIDQEGRDVASHWAALRKVTFGKAIPSAVDLLQISSYGRPEEFDRDTAERMWRDMCHEITQLGHMEFNVIENIVIHEQWPRWLDARSGPKHSNRKRFEDAIAALSSWRRKQRKLAA